MASCTECGENLIAGSLFCDACGMAQSKATGGGRKLRQKSFSKVKDATGGLLTPGEKLRGRRSSYIIEEAIARSGFGATFRALREKDAKQVLIKQMLEQSAYDQVRKQLVEGFKREGKFLKRMKHPAFPRGFEFFERHHSYYIVMEFINGKDLSKAVDDYAMQHGKVEDGLIVHLGKEIADALEMIHQAQYVYRDLKPQNIMLDGISGRVKIIDFGTLYRSSDKNPLLFESEGYTPPEFLDRSTPIVSNGDIFSLGALLYELAVGEPPSSISQMAGKTQVSGNPFSSRLKATGRDKRLLEIIEKCLHLSPELRFQRAKHVRDALDKLTRKGIWPFRNQSAIVPIELSVLPKTLYPSVCTFCDYCGRSDSTSQAGYCGECRVPLKVGVLRWNDGLKDREFYLYSDETTVGPDNSCHVGLPGDGKKKPPSAAVRIFREGQSFWLEISHGKNGYSHAKDQNIRINNRNFLGPIELLEEDSLKLGDYELFFDLKEAC